MTLWSITRSIAIFLLMAGSLMILGCSSPKPPENVTPPVAEKHPEELTIHDHTRIDNYYWLNQRENPEVIKYLEDENSYTTAMMKHTEKFQSKLYKEMIGRIKEDDASLPYMFNKYWYQTRFEKGSEYPIHIRKKGTFKADEEILLDVPKLALGHAYYQARGLSVSPDNKLMAFGVDTVSRRKYTLHFKNLETGELLSDNLPNTTGSTVWAADNQHIFYVTKDSTLRPHMIWRHKLGTDIKHDVLIHHESDNTFGTGVFKSKSGEYIFIGSQSTLSSEVRFVKADKPTDKFTIIQKRAKNWEYSVSHRNNDFYILTNWKARNFRLMKTPVKRSGRRHWKELIKHRDDELLTGISLFKDHMVIQSRKGGLNRINITDLKKHKSHMLSFDENAYTIRIGMNPEMDTKTLRFNYTSMTTPGSIYDYNMSTKKRELKKQDEVLGEFNKEDYKTERIWAEARDGVKVPITLLYHKDIQRDGTNPLHLYAYGSYGASMDPSFRSSRLSLVDRGFIYAIAHIRGGQEMGRHWYEDGKLFKKMNTFTDFIDCGKYLIDQRWADADKLCAEGGSAGGLLMGAVINMAPQLFKGVIAAVPFVDVVTTMLDDTIPLTTSEYDEWGNPNKKDYYNYMLSYSPYDNVETKEYPALLVTTGLHDSQVQYWEPAKWVAKLRDMKTDSNLLILRTNMDFGHGGASGRFERYKERAMEYAFILDGIGINK
ncbi:S9 family peptidase [bacterium]|nr:S9 family peptidase [bacterium]